MNHFITYQLKRLAFVVTLIGAIHAHAGSNQEKKHTDSIQSHAKSFNEAKSKQDKRFEEQTEKQNNRLKEKQASQDKRLENYQRLMRKRLNDFAQKQAKAYLKKVSKLFAPQEKQTSEKQQLLRGIKQAEAVDHFVEQVVPDILQKNKEKAAAAMQKFELKLQPEVSTQLLEKLALESVEVGLPKPMPKEPQASLLSTFINKKLKPFTPPLSNPRIGQRNSMFGRRNLKVGGKHLTTHCGIDMPHPKGTPLVAMGDGTIITIGDNKRSGKFIIVKADDKDSQGNPLYYSMSHLSQIASKRKEGQRVQKNKTVLGYIGNSGGSAGAHLHLAIKETLNGKQRFANPYKWVKGLPSPKNINDPWFQYEYCRPLSP